MEIRLSKSILKMRQDMFGKLGKVESLLSTGVKKCVHFKGTGFDKIIFLQIFFPLFLKIFANEKHMKLVTCIIAIIT